MNFQIKPGVKIEGIAPEMVVGLIGAVMVYQRLGHNFRLTEATGGKHKVGSLHYVGRAIDCGLVQIENRAEWPLIRDGIKASLGDDFDVILEDKAPGGPHVHIEYDPKPKVVKV